MMHQDGNLGPLDSHAASTFPVDALTYCSDDIVQHLVAFMIFCVSCAPR